MNIYFSGIGGVGIGPLAEIAFDAGYAVVGSDLDESLTTQELQARGIEVTIGQDGSFLKACHAANAIDWFVHTAALPDNHPELVTAKQLGIKTAKRDELLAHIIADKNLQLIAVAGTHGKTTTTGMLVWTLQQLGIPVSYSIGSQVNFGPSGKFTPGSNYFVYECDEFDRNFLHFNPALSLITSIDYDHPDTYPTEPDYMTAFNQFINQSDSAIMWRHDGDKINATQANGWILNDKEVIETTIPGDHNRRNATLVIKAVEKLGITENAVAAINSFPGTIRRFEKLGDNLYSDYGHHPVEIAATLQMAREVADQVVLIYQPHQNVRQHEIRDQYTDQFTAAEQVYWLPTYLSREDPGLAILGFGDLTTHITNLQDVHAAEMNESLWEIIQTARSQGKLVLCMGAGSIDTWVRQQNNQLV